MMKYSRQRAAILSFLRSRKDHPSAEFVYMNVKEQFPNISLGTVYRNLTFLVDNGMAMKVPCSDGSVHFDGNVNPHYHFQCSCCKSVIDLDMGDISYIDKEAARNFDGMIQGHSIYFCGLCRDCLQNQNN